MKCNMKQILTIVVLLLSIHSFSQDDTDSIKKNRNDKSLYFTPKANVNAELVTTLLKDFDSTEILNSGVTEFRLKRIGRTFNSTSMYVALNRTKSGKYVLKAHFRYFDKLATFIQGYTLYADGLFSQEPQYNSN